MTIDDLRASLPERLRKYDILPPMTHLDDANLILAYYIALIQEKNEVGPAIITLPACPHCGKRLP